MTKPETLIPPKAKKIFSERTLHNDKFVDYYDWLREKENPEVLDYLKAENHYADGIMADSARLQQTLYDEYFSHIKEDDDTLPYKNGGYLYFTREEKGKNYRKHFRKKDSPGANEELILDVNEIAKGLPYCAVEVIPSPDNKTLCYLIDTKGDYSCTVYFKKLDDGSKLDDTISNAGQLVWSNDSKAFYYCIYEKGSFGRKAYRHLLGTGQEDDTLIIEEKNDRYAFVMYASKSKRFIFLESGCMTNNECYYIDQFDSKQELKQFTIREENVRYSIEHNGDRFFILTNLNAPDYKIMTTPVDKISEENWSEFIGEKNGVKIENFEVFKDYLIVNERGEGLTKFKAIKFKDNSSCYIDFPESAYSAFPVDNTEFDCKRFRYEYMSMVTPRTIFEYDMESNKNTLLKEKEIPGYNKNDYTCERLNVTSHDGKQIPLSIVYKNGFKKDGSVPALIHSYGSYGISMEIFFSTIRLPLLDRGFVYAVAHVRGGSELGQKWYEDGKMLNKKNTFHDFISCCEFLISEGYTYLGGISAEGASAGGLLLGVVANMRPDLFRCILAMVPYVDALNALLDIEHDNSAFHYDEFGNPGIQEEYFYVKSYSPYENVKRQEYPNMLLTAGMNDVQVHYWEPAKLLAILREYNSGAGTLALKTRFDSAHFGSSGKYDMYKEFAYNYAFMLSCYGIEK